MIVILPGPSTRRHHHADSQKPTSFERGTVFSLKDVGVSFGKTQALRNIELHVNRGETLFVTGPSGAGKTTLLRVLAGSYRPTSGVFQNHARDLFISQVFQDLRLLMDMSVRDNLMLAYDNYLYESKAHFFSDLMELSKILDFEDKLDLKISCANGGLKQKTAVVRALLARPDIFIADEPTSSLDLQNAEKLFQLLNLYNTKRNMSVIWATHNKELVKGFSGRIVHLDKGKLVYSGHACFI